MSRLYISAIGLLIVILALSALIPYLFLAFAALVTIIITAQYLRKPRYTPEYNDYMLSDVWKAKRNKVLIRDNYQCQLCKTKLTTFTAHVHHKSYKYFGNEPLHHLITLCKPCHEKIHGRRF